MRAPEMMAMYAAEIKEQTFITTFLISSLFFSVFLYLIKHVEQLRKELAQKVRYDHLTGVLSREAFLSDFNDYTVSNKDDAFLIIDADYFKRINDNYGHGVGDKALVTITQALEKGIRKTDTIGRIGGEEFAVHLKDADETLVLEIAERLRENVRLASDTFEFPNVDLSVSIGAVIYKEEVSLPTLMQMADDLLYKAKENGRNRVEHLLLNHEVLA